MLYFLSNNKDFIALVISIISLALSIYNLAYSLYSKRCDIKIVIHNHMSNNNTQQFFVTVENCSQLPISISSIQLNESSFCVLEPTLIKELIRHSGNQVISRVETKTIPFPINLNSLESRSGYLEFRNISNFDIDNISFSLYTNRKSFKNIKPIIYDDLTKK